MTLFDPRLKKRNYKEMSLTALMNYLILPKTLDTSLLTTSSSITTLKSFALTGSATMRLNL